MEEYEQIKLLLADETVLICSEELSQQSVVLREIQSIPSTNNDFIQVPKFVTRNVLSDIMYLLREKQFASVRNSSCLRIVEIMRTVDYLLIEEVMEPLKVILKERLTFENAFPVFQIAKSILSLEDISSHCSNIIMTFIQSYYEACRIFYKLIAARKNV